MKKLLAKIRKILHDRRTRQMLTRIVSVTAAIVVFITTYALVLPAITMESEANCGIEAHQHDESCYEDQLICGEIESPGHHHSEACYKVSKALVCEEQEHQHDDSCFDESGNLTCDQPEHTHDDTCYKESRELTCDIPESDGHQHSSACYDRVLTCGKEIHTHSTACYDHASDSAASAPAGFAAVATTELGSFGATVSASTEIETESGESDAASSETSDAWAAEKNVEGEASSSTTTNVSTTAATTAGSSSTAAAAANTATASTGKTAFDSAAAEDTYIPQLEPVIFEQLLTKDTDIYYYHAEEGEEAPESSADIADWKRVNDDTELTPADLLRVYLRYTIPAGTLNATNDIARYRLPSNLHLTDQQMETINTTVNGVANQYVSLDTLEITDTEKYNTYLGIEATEGTRTPSDDIDKYFKNHPDLEGQEYINAVVRAENVFDDTTGEYAGQDLVFTFSPYTVQKNQHEYDADGQPTKAGQKVDGWLCFDLHMDQIDWSEPVISTIDNSAESIQDNATPTQDESVETAEGSGSSDATEATEITDSETEEETSSSSSDPDALNTNTITEKKESSAEIIFSAKDKALKMDEISTELHLVEVNTIEKENDVAQDDHDQSADDFTDEDQPESEIEVNAETYPEVSFEDTITVQAGTLTTDNETAAQDTPAETAITVSVIAEEETFPLGTTMQLGTVEDMDTVASAVEGAVEGQTRGFHAVDISFHNADGEKIEPLKPIKVSMTSDAIKQAVEDASMAPVVVHVEDSAGLPANSTDAEENSVNIKLQSDREAEKSENTPIATIVETNEASAINGTSESTETADTLSFDAGSFSVYAIVYTVDFEYSVNGKMYQFSLPGGGFVSFTDLVEVLGIIGDTNSGENGDENGSVITENSEENAANEAIEEDGINSDTNTTLTLGDVEVSEATRKFVADVTSVEFSSPELVDVSKVENETTVGQIKESRGLECEYSAELTEEQIAEINAQTVKAGDWALISMQPFVSEETLTVTMKDGEAFSIHVTDAQIKKTVIDARGDTWEITVTYGEDAQIPDGAELEVREIESGTETFEQLLRDSTAELDNTDGIITFARFFDIQILNGQEKIEPAVPVAVTIRYVDPINMNDDGKLSVIHFSEQKSDIVPEVINDINIHQDADAITYDQDSFSVTGTVVQTPVPSHNYALVLHHTDGNYYVVENDGTLTRIQETDIEFNGDGSVKSVKMINPICWNYQDIGYGNYNIWHDTDAWDYHGSGLASRYTRRYLCAHNDNGYRDIRDIDVNVWDGINIQYDQNNHLLHQGQQTLTVGQDEDGVLKIHGNGSYGNAATIYFAETRQVSSVSVQNHTVSHIDISVESKAGIKVPLAYGSYRLATVDADGNITGYREEPLVVSRQNDVTLEVERMVPIKQEDLKKADITTYTEWKGYREYLDDVYTVTGYSGNGETSSDTAQVRLEGSFKVADMEPAPSWCDTEYKANNYEYFENGENTHRAIKDVRLERPIHYSVAITKPVTFTMTYKDPATGTEYVVLKQDGTPFQKTVDVTLSSSFTYWDEDNTCPGIDQGTYGRSRWGAGEIWSNDDIYYDGTYLDAGPGMDFRLGAPMDDTRHDIVAVEIVKYVQGDYGNEVRTLSLSDATECSFDVYQNGESAPLHSKTMEVGKDGMGMLYDYDVTAGTYNNPATAQISEDPDSVADVIYDSSGNKWVYDHSRVETEFAYRNNGQDNPSRYVSDDYTKENGPYYSESEVIGEYTVQGGRPYDYNGEHFDGVHEYNRFLEFYVYNIYKPVATDITIKKVDNNSQPLSNAVFEIYKSNDAVFEKVTHSTYTWLDENDQFTVPAEGYTLTGLTDGTYQIKEIKPPDGYVITEDTPITFTVENGTVVEASNDLKNGATYTPAQDAVEDDPVTTDTDESKEATNDTFTIPNTPGAALPSTGGPGTRLFTILGSILIAGAGVLLWRRRRTI